MLRKAYSPFPLSNIDPTGLDCVYLNDAGDTIESIDAGSDIGECQANGGYWANGTVVDSPFSIITDPNSNNILIYSYINGQLGISLASQTFTQGAFTLGEAPSSFFPFFQPSYIWGQTYSQQLLGAAAKGANLAAHAIPVPCGGGVFAYAGPAREKGSAEGSANVLLEYDTNQGFTVNGLFEGGQAGGPGGGVIVGKTGVTPLAFIPTGGAGGVVVLNGAVGLYAGGGAGPVGYGAGVYVNITSAAACK